MAKKPLKFGSRKRYAEGGSTDRNKARYDRKVADIESDYKKAQERKTGRAAEVAKAKYEQRMADAKDDLAKWTGSDRSQTSAAEKAAERNLTMTRRFGSAEPKFDDKPLGSARPSDAELSKIAESAGAAARQGMADTGKFGEAFKAARAAGDKTFTWRGKSYNTKLASEGAPRSVARPAATSARPAATSARPAAAPPGRSATTTPAAGRGTSTGAKVAAAVAGGPSVIAAGEGARSGVRAAFSPAAKPQPTQSQRYSARAAELAAEARREAAEEKATGSAGARARLKNMFGFGSSAAERASKMYTQSAQSSAKQERALAESKRRDAAEQAAEAAAKAKKRAERIAAGSRPGATSTEKFYAKYPDAMKKGGKVAKKPAPVKKYAKGGKIDGCAVRGMTKAKRAR